MLAPLGLLLNAFERGIDATELRAYFTYHRIADEVHGIPWTVSPLRSASDLALSEEGHMR